MFRWIPTLIFAMALIQSSHAQQVPPRLAASDLEELSVLELQELMASGRLTARRLTEFYLERIADYDKQGPGINAIQELNPDALAIAAALDREREEKGARGPLHGIPVILKDAFDTKDGMSTSNGSYLYMDTVPARDSWVAEKLREAGAVLLAKANMDELACCNGVASGRGGAVRNPYALDRFASGSSSGSAAAVAANFGAFAMGGDTRSSIRFPAAACSLVGLKPTMGLISRAGVVPADVSLDVVGPMARSVADVALVTGLLVGVDPRDPATKESRDRFAADYTAFLDRGALEGARLGVARAGFFGVTESIDAGLENALEVLRREGAVLVDPVSIEAIPYGGSREEDREILTAAAHRAEREYLENLAPDSPIRSFEQLRALALIGRFPTAVAPSFDPPADAGAPSLPLDHPDYLAARDRFYEEQRAPILAIMAEHDLDAIVFPTMSRYPDRIVPAPGDGEIYPSHRGQPEIANYAGWPEITVPAGFSPEGLPIGISFLGRAFSEGKLLALAYAFEQATRHRRAPDLTKRPSAITAKLPEIPANDSFANREQLAGRQGSLRGNNLLATTEVGEPRFNDEPIERTVWYSFTAPIDGEAVFDTRGSSPAQLSLAAYRGDGFQALELIGASEYEQALRASVLRFAIEAGTTYQVVVGTTILGGYNGRYVLRWESNERWTGAQDPDPTPR